MRRLPVIVNKPVRGGVTRYRPGLSRAMAEAVSARPAAVCEEPPPLTSRRIGSTRVIAPALPRSA